MRRKETHPLWAVGAAALGTAWVIREVYRRQNEANLTGQTALVTGGSRGLGLCIARELIREGCRVALCARDENELYRAKEILEAEGGTVFVFVCDSTDEAQVQETVRKTLAHYGHVDLLVNDIGQISTGPAQLMTVQDYKHEMEVNFYSTLHFTYALLPHFQSRGGGRILNIASLGGRIAVPHLLPYSCSKFALTAFSEGLRAELRRDRITVTTILPGTLRTGSHYQAKVKGQRAKEYRNFALSATLPLLSYSAEAAAKEAVSALKRGEAERVISPPAKLAATVHGLFPGVTADFFALFNEYVLPSPEGEKAFLSGKQVVQDETFPWMPLLSKRGRSTAERLNQFAPNERN